MWHWKYHSHKPVQSPREPLQIRVPSCRSNILISGFMQMELGMYFRRKSNPNDCDSVSWKRTTEVDTELGKVCCYAPSLYFRILKFLRKCDISNLYLDLSLSLSFLFFHCFDRKNWSEIGRDRDIPFISSFPKYLQWLDWARSKPGA